MNDINLNDTNNNSKEDHFKNLLICMNKDYKGFRCIEDNSDNFILNSLIHNKETKIYIAHKTGREFLINSIRKLFSINTEDHQIFDSVYFRFPGDYFFDVIDIGKVIKSNNINIIQKAQIKINDYLNTAKVYSLKYLTESNDSTKIFENELKRISDNYAIDSLFSNNNLKRYEMFIRDYWKYMELGSKRKNPKLPKYFKYTINNISKYINSHNNNEKFIISIINEILKKITFTRNSKGYIIVNPDFDLSFNCSKNINNLELLFTTIMYSCVLGIINNNKFVLTEILLDNGMDENVINTFNKFSDILEKEIFKNLKNS